MEKSIPQQYQFTAVDMQFHGRDQHPTVSLESAVKKAVGKGSPVVRVYGKPVFVLDEEKKLVYLRIKFSPEITQKLIDGTLVIPPGMVPFIDAETQARIKAREKRRLKNGTKVWHKRK